MTKLSKVGFFLFVLNFNYLWLRIIVFNYFYNNFGNMGLIYGLILTAIVLVLICVIPKKIINTDFKNSYNKSIFKYLYGFIIFIETVVGLSIVVYMLHKIFISDSNYLILLSLLCLCIGFISNNQVKDIMEISTLFSIIGYGLFFISLIYFPSIDYSLLLPIKYDNPIVLILFSLMIFGDNLKILINKENIKINKWLFVIPIIIAILLFCLEYFILIGNAGTIIFKDIYWVGFICLSLEQVTKYIGNFDFIYIYLILVCSIFKFSLNMNLFRETIKNKSNIINLGIGIILFICCLLIYRFIKINDLISLSPYIISASIIILLWFLKECYFVRRIKE